jgi:non-ribosomal peptide synthase protein (TIGR01720 family)
VGARTPTEELLCGIWAEVLGLGQVGVHDNFFELGGDSILSIQVVARATQAGFRLTARDLFEHQTIARLSDVRGGGQELRAALPSTGEFALTPIQEWFYAQGWERPWHYNQGALLADAGKLAGGRLQQAVEQVLGSHEVFRLRFGRKAGGKRWQRYVGASGSGSGSGSESERGRRCGRADLRGLPGAVQGRVVEAVAAQVQSSLEPEQGRVVAALRLEASSGGGRLLVVAHHLVIDGVSWRILLDEVERAYGGLVGARVGVAWVSGGGGGSSYGEWAERLVAEAGSAATAAELEYWEAQQEGEELPREQELGADTVGAAEAVTVEFSAAETSTLLRGVPRQLRAQLEEVLLLGVVEAVCEWSGRERLVVRCEGHGREPLSGVAVEQTVGWFTTLYPVRFERGRGSVRERLRGVQQRLQAVPRRGLGYGLLKYVQGAAGLAGEWEAGVSFNYLGQWDANLAGIFQGAAESVGRSQWAGERRGAAWEVHGSVHGGQLRLAWSYSRNAHRRETMERVAARFRAVVMEVIAACRDQRQLPAPAEVSDISLSDLEWKDLLAEVGARE